MNIGNEIDLLPKATEEEIQETVKKGRINLSGVFFIFLVVLFSLAILGGNLLARMEHNNKLDQRAKAESEVESLRYVELRQKTLNQKIETYESVKEYDFNADKVLDYLLDVTEGLSETSSLYVDAEMEFEIRGEATSYSNVARLWHDMSREEDYFENINLEYVRKNTSDEGEDVVYFQFTGTMIRDNVSEL